MVNDSRRLLVSAKLVFSSSLLFICVYWKTFLSFTVFLKHLQEYDELKHFCSNSLQSKSTKEDFYF